MPMRLFMCQLRDTRPDPPLAFVLHWQMRVGESAFIYGPIIFWFLRQCMTPVDQGELRHDPMRFMNKMQSY